MAILNLDLLNSDQTIDSDNADDTNTVNIVALGTHTLTVDGVSATVSGLAGVQAASSRWAPIPCLASFIMSATHQTYRSRGRRFWGSTLALRP